MDFIRPCVIILIETFIAFGHDSNWNMWLLAWLGQPGKQCLKRLTSDAKRVSGMLKSCSRNKQRTSSTIFARVHPLPGKTVLITYLY